MHSFPFAQIGTVVFSLICDRPTTKKSFYENGLEYMDSLATNSGMLDGIDHVDDISLDTPAPLPETRGKGGMEGAATQVYAFAGMHAIFEDSNKAQITTLQFANEERDRLAFGTWQGTLCIASVGAEPTLIAKVSFSLSSHAVLVFEVAGTLAPF